MIGALGAVRSCQSTDKTDGARSLEVLNGDERVEGRC